jgi:hypothetical protein
MNKSLFVFVFALLTSLSQGELIQREMTSTPQVSNGLVTYNSITNQIIVPEGKIMKVIDFYHGGGFRYFPGSPETYTGILIRYGSSTNVHAAYSWGSISALISPVGKTFYGPCVVDIYLDDRRSLNQQNYGVPDGAYVHYVLDLQPYGSDSTSSSGLIPSSSIVVPSNAVGDVDVLLEQSNDMITWTQCLPGTYNASTQKRFFRVRAVER